MILSILIVNTIFGLFRDVKISQAVESPAEKAQTPR